TSQAISPKTCRWFGPLLLSFMAVRSREKHHEVVAYPDGVAEQIVELLLCAASDQSEHGCVARRVDDVSSVFLIRFGEGASLRRKAGTRNIEIGRQGEVSTHRDGALI